MTLPSWARQSALFPLAAFALLLSACGAAPVETAVPERVVANPVALAPPTTSTVAPPATTAPPTTLAPATTAPPTTSIAPASESDQASAPTPTTSQPAAPPPEEFSVDTAAADDAYGRLLQETSMSFVMVTSVDSDLGEASSLQRGVWVSEIGSETSVVFELDDTAVSIAQAAVEQDGGLSDEASDAAFAEGVRYRFFGDDTVWVKESGEPWKAIDSATAGLDALEPTGDAATYLEPFVNAIVGVAEGEPHDDGATRYPLRLDADAFVPLIAQPQTAQNIYDQGWDGVSGQTIDGEIVIASDGTIIAVGVDQTAWWEAGWDVAGVSDVLDGTTVTWSMAIDVSPQALELPCSNPTPSTDPELGATLVCSS